MERRSKSLVEMAERISKSIRTNKAFGVKYYNARDYLAWYSNALLQSDLSNMEVFLTLKVIERLSDVFIDTLNDIPPEKWPKPKGL